MIDGVLASLLITTAYTLIFLGGEILYRRTGIGAEGSRKVTHVAGGFLALALPMLFDSWQIVVLLGLLFAATLLVTKWRGLIASVHGVQRKTLGEIWFPIALATLFALCTLTDTMAFYAPSILTLTLGDAAAWFFGSRFGQRRLPIGDRSKSLVGSLALFATAAVVVAVGLVLEGVEGNVSTLVLATLLAATSTTTAEGLSRFGLDNLTVPLAVWASLAMIIGVDAG